MRLLEALATTFFKTFGITEPGEKALRRAAWFLLGMLTLVLVGLGAAGFLLFRLL